MENTNREKHTDILRRIAYDAMRERGLFTEFPAAVLDEMSKAGAQSAVNDTAVNDLTGLLWCSIDNDSSLDLDQLTAAVEEPNGHITVLVAIADVDVFAPIRSATDSFAALNTLSVYTPAVIFPMLPVKLSNGLTSLNFGLNRPAVIISMTIAPDGSVVSSSVYRAIVRNKAKLAYDSVAGWLTGAAQMPAELSSVQGLPENIKLQDTAAQSLKAARHANGALHLITLQSHPVFEGGNIKALELDSRNRAKDIIEDFMIAANGVTARFLEAKNFPSIRRVVHTPKKWDGLISLAAGKNYKLPDKPDAKALEAFLLLQKKEDPEHYPDISLSVIKLLGPGEYALEVPGGSTEGHFGLAVRDYAHSTAPNRRYPDLITQRLLKAAFDGALIPYKPEELDLLAKHCTEKENDAKKVERRLDKSAAALLMESMIGKEFDALVTGASDKGTYVRIFDPPVEGRLGAGLMGLEVGHKVRVVLKSTDVERGFIDFGLKSL